MSETRQKPTEADRLFDLTPRQVQALGLILSGMKDGDVGKAVGVTRQTVSEWKRRHPAFRARLTSLIRDRSDALSHQAAELGRDALELVSQAVAQGDVRAALAYLRLGLGGPCASGAEDAESVMLAELPRRDPLKEMLDQTEPPTEADRRRLEASISERIEAAALSEEPG